MNNPFEIIDEKLCRIESYLLELRSQSEQRKPDTEALLNAEEAAAFLNIAVQTLYGYTSQRRIPYIKKEKKLYFDRSDLLAWLKQGKHKTIEELIEDHKESSNSKKR